MSPSVRKPDGRPNTAFWESAETAKALEAVKAALEKSKEEVCYFC